MLVLTRRRNEVVDITIGDVTVSVTVADIRGDRVRLGFDAPRNVLVNRREVLEQIREDALENG